MDPVALPATIEVGDASAASAPTELLEASSESTPQTSTTQELPPAGGALDLNKLSGLADTHPMLLLALAVLAVVGGPLGWRMWQKISEQKHEQAMAKLALEREMAGLNGAQPPPCQASTLKMQKEIEALEKRLGKVERRASPSLPSDFDADDLIARVEKIEKAAKAQVRAGKA